MAIDMIGIAICTQCYQVLAIATHAFLYTVMLILVVLTQDIPGQPGQMATLAIWHLTFLIITKWAFDIIDDDKDMALSYH